MVLFANGWPWVPGRDLPVVKVGGRFTGHKGRLGAVIDASEASDCQNPWEVNPGESMD